MSRSRVWRPSIFPTQSDTPAAAASLWSVSSTTKTRTDMQGSYTAPGPAPRPQWLRIEAAEALQDRDQEVGGSPGRVSRSGRGDLRRGRGRRGGGDGDRRSDRRDRGLNGDD